MADLIATGCPDGTTAVAAPDEERRLTRLSGWVRSARPKVNPGGIGQTDCGIRMEAYGTWARGPR